MNNKGENYLIHDISCFESDMPEQQGTKEKFWYLDNEKEFLFKSVKSKTGNRFGDDWAEKIACELAEVLGIPHAHYELAIYQGVRGVITENFITQRGEYLIPGNELLQEYIDNFNEENPNIQYIDDVYKVMDEKITGKPIGFESLKGIKTASEFFLGYLLFDTLISNQDRHNENWGMIVTLKGTNHLAPSYDHGASLARNESDDVRAMRLQSRDKGRQIPTYVGKAKSQFLDRATQNRLKLLEVFRCYGQIEKNAARAWLDQLALLSDTHIQVIIDRVPEELMSDVAKVLHIS